MCYRAKRARSTAGGFSHYAKHTRDFVARGPSLRNAPGSRLRGRANWGQVCAAAGTHPPRPCGIPRTGAGCVPAFQPPPHTPATTLRNRANWGRVRARGAGAPAHTSPEFAQVRKLTAGAYLRLVSSAALDCGLSLDNLVALRVPYGSNRTTPTPKFPPLHHELAVTKEKHAPND